jgi:prevent-host-death family protein
LTDQIDQFEGCAMASRKRVRHPQEEPASFRAGPGLRAFAASEAKTHFAELLDAVERGETVAITRHGRVIARLVPEAEGRQQEINQALADIDALRAQILKRTGPISAEEIVSSIHEGHRI